MKTKIKPWCLKYKKNYLPMSKYLSRTKTDGKWDVPRLTVCFDWQRALTFKTKDAAWACLDKKYMKYGKQAYHFEPYCTEKLIKKQKVNPVLQLHTNKILNVWIEYENKD